MKCARRRSMLAMVTKKCFFLNFTELIFKILADLDTVFTQTVLSFSLKVYVI
jgi:hypothetical protein